MQNEEFLAALAGDMPEDERLILCYFRGDPGEVDVRAWRPRPWTFGRDCPSDVRDNAYVTISSFRRAADETWRRRGECWAAGRALMVDDVGTKLPATVVDPLPPSAMIETSPGNFQAWYLLAEPLRDRERFDQLIRAFIDQQLLGNDPGMSGVTRVGRLPVSSNTKAKYGGDWRVRAALWEPTRRYTVEDIVAAFGLVLLRRRKRIPTMTDQRATLAEMWGTWFTQLHRSGMLKRDEPDVSGWYEMTCPWVDEHTGRLDNGAAIREPHEENGWTGAFRCHHGSCAGRGWQQLTDWLDAQNQEQE